MLSNERNGFKPTYLHRYFDVLFPPHPHPTRAKVRTSGKPLPSPVTSHILRLPMNLVSRISAFVPTMTCSLPLVPISKPSQNTPTPPSRPMSQIREPLRSDLTFFGVLFATMIIHFLYLSQSCIFIAQSTKVLPNQRLPQHSCPWKSAPIRICRGTAIQ